MKAPAAKPRATDLDCHIGARMRERRIMLGLTQQQMAKLIGVSYQQQHKREIGVNRVSASDLFRAASVLGVKVDYFFEDLENSSGAAPSSHQRTMLALAKDFSAIPSQRHRELLCMLARALASAPE